MIRVVAAGTWLYDGEAPMKVCVVECDRDFWYDLGKADDDLTEGDAPRLNPNGRCYYLLYRGGWTPGETFWPDSVGFMSLEEAQAAAEAKLPSTVTWKPF